MPTIEEKRVYTDQTGRNEVYVASDIGVIVVTVSDDLVGEFSLAHAGAARDVAAGVDHVAVATAEDVLLLESDSFEPAGFGSAVAVDVEAPDHDEISAVGSDGKVTATAADDEGTIARRQLSTATGDEAGEGDDQWAEVGTVDESVTAIDWPFVATSGGLYRGTDAGLEHVGLTAVTDVAAAGVPMAATETGLYRLGNGWMSVLDGHFDAVASDGHRCHAAGEGGLYDGTADWEPLELPVTERVRELSYTPTATVGVTEAGTLLLSTGADWRTRALGITGVEGVAVR